MKSANKLIILPSILLFLSFSCLHYKNTVNLQVKLSQTPELEKQIVTGTGKDSGLHYLVTLPKDYADQQEKKWPLLIFLHSLEERGLDLQKLIDNPNGEGKGLAYYALQNQDFPFITVSPLCPKRSGWPFLNKKLLQLVNETCQEFRVQAGAVFLTGVSMGGMGCWSFAMRYPEKIKAAAPISGGIYSPPMSGDVKKLRDLPLRVYHDLYDPSIPITAEVEYIIKLKKLGGKVDYIISKKEAHYIHEEIYADGRLFDWFLEQLDEGK